MGRKGRLSHADKEKPVDPVLRAVADKWMETIGREYEDIKNACRINAHKNDLEWSEDVFHSSIESCYSSICRNNLKDTSSQGCKDYLFKAVKMNLLHDKVEPYNARKSDGEEFFKTYDVIDENDAETKAMDEVFKDFCVHRILEEVEKVFDPQSFYLYRIKFLVPKTSYRRLVAMTGIKNAKSKVQAVVEWCKQNISEEQLIKEFEINFGK